MFCPNCPPILGAATLPMEARYDENLKCIVWTCRYCKKHFKIEILEGR